MSTGTLGVRIYQDYNRTLLEDDVSNRWTDLLFSTSLHGGFKDCHVSIPTTLPMAWNYLNRDTSKGLHFAHLEVRDSTELVWQGRILDIGLRVDSSFIGLNIAAAGYWSSMRDLLYLGSGTVNGTATTDWKTGGPFYVSDIIRELITIASPDINGTANIDINDRDITGINLDTRAYPMDIIVDKLAPIQADTGDANAIYYFAVWGNRVPAWKKRSGTNLDWIFSLDGIESLQLVQDGKHLRNTIIPQIGNTIGTTTSDAESQRLYPKREIILNLPTGLPNAAANAARDLALTERKQPRQDQEFVVKGEVWDTRTVLATGNQPATRSGNLFLRPKWWVRAGQTCRIKDLSPYTQPTSTLDDVRTFYILETRYDAGRDVLELQPDRAPSQLSVLLTRLGQLEKK